MNVNRNLLVSFSNGVNWNGLMTLEFVQRRADEEYPDSNIEILVSEFHATENESNTINYICQRIRGDWVVVDPNKQ